MTAAGPDVFDQLFGYRGVIDERDGWREVAPDVILTPFWTPSFCATVIRAAEAIGAFEPSEDDPVPGHEVSLAVISPRLFEAVQQDIGIRIWPRLRELWPYIDYHGLRDVFVIRYARRRAGGAAHPPRRRPGFRVRQAERRLRGR